MIKSNLISQKSILILLLLMSILNWIFEIFKWQVLVRNIRNISFSEALLQTLVSHSFSIITPFKTGDYAFKTLFYHSAFRLKILGLNGLGNIFQLFVTILFGIVGFIILIQYHIFDPKLISLNLRFIIELGILGFIILMYFIYKSDWYKNLKTKTMSISKKTVIQVLFYSLLRYLLFSHQFYIILIVFGIKLPYLQTIGILFCMYLISSFFPIFALFDFVIKGSVALFLFSKFEVSQTIVVTSTTLMWLLNFIMPAIIGVFFISTLKKEKIILNAK